MKNTEEISNKKPLRLKDIIPVDYTDDSWPEDEVGQLAYDYYKRLTDDIGESWTDNFLDRYITKLSYLPASKVLTVVFRNYEKWPVRYRMEPKDWEAANASQNRIRYINQLLKAGKISPIVSYPSQPYQPQMNESETRVSKYELNAELRRTNARIKFLRSAHYGSALPKDVSSEISNLIAKRDSILSILKEEDIVEDGLDIYEALNIMQRMKRRAIMRRNKSKILMGRRRAQRRRATTSALQQRSMRAARAVLSRRILRKDKGDASYGEKVRAEKALASRGGAIKRLARKLLSRIRQKEQQKFQRKRAAPPRPIQSVKPIQTPKRPS